jgi:hypothetical protein
VLIVDDVISAGTSVRESVELIRAAGATPAGVLIALDRQERGQGELSAVQEVQRDYGIPVIAVAGLKDLMTFLAGRPDFAAHRIAVANIASSTALMRKTDTGPSCCLLAVASAQAASRVLLLPGPPAAAVSAATPCRNNAAAVPIGFSTAAATSSRKSAHR